MRRWQTGLIAAAALGLLAWLVASWLGDEAPQPGTAAVAPPPAESAPEANRPAARPDAQKPREKHDTETATAATRLLFGYVRDPSDQPVVGATVRAIQLGNQEALVGRAGDDGSYVVFGVPASIARLEISAAGYEPQAFDRPSFPSMRRVRWDVVLVPASGVHGLVRSGGAPVAGARVSLMKAGEHRLLSQTRSDGDGRFALDLKGAQVAGLEVAAFHAQYGRGKVEIQGAGPVIVELPGGGFIEGKVTEPSGQPVESFVASASSLAMGETGPPAQSFDSESGQYRLGPLAAGRQRVWVASQGYQPGQSKPVQVVPGETVTGVDFILLRSTELTGRVINAVTKQPIEGALVAPAEWSADALAEAVGAFTDTQGRYSLKSLPGGRTTIRASASGYRPLMHGGIEGGAKTPQHLDFALTPVARGERPQSELTGIGAQLSMTEQGVVVAGLIPGGAAAERLKQGDVIVMVGDQPVGGLDFGELVQRIRGDAGTEVALWVRRGGTGAPERVTLERRRVSMPRD